MDPPSIFLSSINIVFKLFFAAILADIIPQIPPPMTNTSQCSCLWWTGTRNHFRVPLTSDREPPEHTSLPRSRLRGSVQLPDMRGENALTVHHVRPVVNSIRPTALDEVLERRRPGLSYLGPRPLLENYPVELGRALDLREGFRETRPSPTPRADPKLRYA